MRLAKPEFLRPAFAIGLLAPALVSLTARGQAFAASDSILRNFDANGPDGCWPEAGLITDVSGNLYGTTLYGWGTVFELTPSRLAREIGPSRSFGNFVAKRRVLTALPLLPA